MKLIHPIVIRRPPQKKIPQLLSQMVSQGFTLAEVMVSLLITMIFLSITLQVFLTAAYLRAKTTEYNDSYNWIQEDFEQILTKAKNYEIQANPHSTRCNPTQSADGLASGFINDATHGLGGSSTNLGQRTFGATTYRLTRSADYTSTPDPDRLLRLNYTISDATDQSVILQLDADVFIYAALNCPRAS